MLRRAFSLAAVSAGTLVWLAPARADEDSRTALRFVQALREHKLFDVATDYLEQLRQERGTPNDVRALIDYEAGRIRLDEADATVDLGRRKELLEEARGELEAFTRGNPNHPLRTEALVQLARLLVERGHLAGLLGEEVDTSTAQGKAEKAAKIAEARTSFDKARAAYQEADQQLQAAYKTYPPFLPDNDPRKEERDRIHTSIMAAQLQKAIVDYEQGETYPLGSPERNDMLNKGVTQFEDLYRRYRTQMAGLTARMWQAKCLEEKGEYGPAMGIYNELMEHQDPRLRPLQRYVGYFQIVLYNKRKEYPLAEKGAVGWLRYYNSPEEQRSNEGLGVKLELTKSLVARLPDLSGEAERKAYTDRAADLLSQVVRYSSPYKSEALELLKKYRPRSAVAFEVVAKLNYEDAMSQSEQAIASREWDKAIVLLKQAIRKADPAKDPEKANLARYKLAYCLYMVKQYYEAEVLAEHLARRYPRFSLAAKATEIGMASLADAYNTYREIDRGSDLNHLIELARYTVETWPDNDPADVARMTLGQIYQGMGRYPEAIAVYEAIRPDASQWVEGQTGAGATHWQYSLALRGSDKVAEADAEVAKALADLNAALKARRHAGATLTDPGLINNACDIADVHLETGKPSEALTLLEPIGKARQGTSGPAFGRLMSTLLRAHVSDGHVDQALADMAALEAAGGAGDSLTQLYFGLGKLLQKEIDRLKQSGDSVGLNKTQQAYQKFLSALASSKTGQTYDSLQWAGENMLTLNDAKEAADVFNRILATFGQDQAFLAQPGGKTRIFRTRLKLVAALRGQRDFTAAEALVDELLKENPGAFKPIMVEKAQLSEDRAVAGSGNWDVAYNRWEKLARKLEQMRPKPIEYFDAWYHAALALSMEKKTTLAKQILASVMRLSPTVGGPEMKAKYVELLSKLK